VRTDCVRSSGRPRWVSIAVAAALSAGTVSAAGHKVDVGGHRLYLRCKGAGSPTVVFDAGAGDTLAVWDWVIPRLRNVTRVCAYDRAGLGRSDPGPTPRTSARIVSELHNLLLRAGIGAPYVLVGHSFGGLNVRLFASTFPQDVQGLVLVDATPVEFPSQEANVETPAEREKQRTSLGMAPQALREELAAMAQSADQVRNAGPLPPVPVVVLTAAHREDSAAFRHAWLAMQRRLAASIPGARQVMAATSDHYVQFDQPDLVVDAVRDVVQTARAPKSD
jgi:pimeloyl-ACP methyl ester carboxylesterase